MTSDEQKKARRAWHGNLNRIPLEIAYDFELQWIAENRRADGFTGSRARVAAAAEELRLRAEGVAAMRER